jgi:hypothetical protein
MFFVLKFELILIIGSNKVLMEGARKVYRGRRVGQGWSNVLVRTILTGLGAGFTGPIHGHFYGLIVGRDLRGRRIHGDGDAEALPCNRDTRPSG